MKKLSAFLLFIPVFLFLFPSCKSHEEKLMARISEMENKFNNDSLNIPDKEQVVALIDMYAEFTENFKESPQSPGYLFSAGTYCMSYNLSTRAIAFFDTLIVRYPSYEKHPDSYFLKAFVYDTQLSNLPNARKAYEELIEKYPDHELAAQAKALVNLLGKDLDAIIKEFEEQNSAHADSVVADVQ